MIIALACFQSSNPEQTNETRYRNVPDDYILGQNEYEVNIDSVPTRFHNEIGLGDEIYCCIDTFGDLAGKEQWGNFSACYQQGRWTTMTSFIKSLK